MVEIPWSLVGPALATLAVVVTGLWLSIRREVNHTVLGPPYAFILKFLDDPWRPSQLKLNPWSRMDPYQRSRAPRGVQERLTDLDASYAALHRAERRFDDFLNVPLSLAHDSSTRIVLAQTLKGLMSRYAANSGFDLWNFGGPRGTQPSFQQLYDALYPYILRNPQDPDAAWTALINSKWSIERHYDLVIEWLLEKDPNVLSEFFRAVAAHPSTAKATELLGAVEEEREDTIRNARRAKARIDLRYWRFPTLIRDWRQERRLRRPVGGPPG